MLNFQIWKMKPWVAGVGNEHSQAHYPPFGLFYRYNELHGLRETTRSRKIERYNLKQFPSNIFSPICYMHPANPFNEEETLSFNQRQWEVIARQGTLPPARKTVNCLPWWIFGQAVDNLKFTSVSLYLKHKNSFWNKSVHAVFLSKNADFSTGPWLFWNQN